MVPAPSSGLTGEITGLLRAWTGGDDRSIVTVQLIFSDFQAMGMTYGGAGGVSFADVAPCNEVSITVVECARRLELSRPGVHHRSVSRRRELPGTPWPNPSGTGQGPCRSAGD